MIDRSTMSGLGPSEKPHWFTRNTADAEAQDEAGKEWDSADVRKRIAGTSNTDRSVISNSDDDDDDSPSMTKRCCLFFISVIFLAFFVYAVTEQITEGVQIEWILFYALSATIPALFLIHWIICFPSKFIYSLCLGMLIWSGIYVYFFSKRFSDDDTDEDEKLRQEDIFEIAGACASFVSTIYHLCVMRCCIRQKKKKEEIYKEIH